VTAIDALDEKVLWEMFHLRWHPHRYWEDGTPRLCYLMFQTNPYQSFSYDLEEGEFEELDTMYSNGASRDEILLWLHEKADAFLDEDELR
jgi:hypothetical protein